MLGCRPVATSRWVPDDRFGAVAGMEIEPVVPLDDPHGGGAQVDVDALGLEDVLDGGGDVLVLARGQPRTLLDDGDPRTEPAIHLGELERDVTAADDHQMLGQDVEVEDADVGEVVDVGQPRDVRYHGPATDVEEDPVGLEHLVVDPDGARSLESGVPANQRAAPHAVEPGLHAVRDRRA